MKAAATWNRIADLQREAAIEGDRVSFAKCGEYMEMFCRIANLQRESASAGDRETYKACAKALAQVCTKHPRRFKAFRIVEAILSAADAMEDFNA